MKLHRWLAAVLFATLLRAPVFLPVSLAAASVQAQVQNNTLLTAPVPKVDGTLGALHVVVFVTGTARQHEGLQIEGPGQPMMPTNRDGAAYLMLPEGDQCIVVGIPAQWVAGRAQGLTHSVCNIPIVAGGSTEILISLDATASRVLTVDKMAPGQLARVREAGRQYQQDLATKPRGKLQGLVQSLDRKKPVEGAQILIRGLPIEAVSDEQGQFELELPEGRYRISVIHSKFSTFSRDEVVVKGKSSTNFDVLLTPSTAELDDFIVSAPYIEGGVASLLTRRRDSASVTDALGSEELAKSPDGSASSATRRIVGASIVGGQFLFVRGLGGRYSNVRLNGVPLPSTDPDLPGFQLDLFPSSLLSSLTIAKTFSPDIPGNFAGGSLNIETRGFPEKFTFSGSVGLSYNTQTTGRSTPSYGGGSLDLLGTDDGTRALPSGFPRQAVTNTNFNRQDRQEVSRAFNDNWQSERRTSRPNISVGATLGDTFDVAGGKFSYLATLGYRVGSSYYQQQVTNAKLQGVGADAELVERESFQREVGQQTAQIGALGSVNYQPNEEHSFTAVSMLTQNGEDRTSVVDGFAEAENATIRDESLRYIERRLTFNQLLGEHRQLGGLVDINWQLNTARTFRSQPDSRRTRYADSPFGFAFVTTTGSGERLYTTLNQSDYGAGVDFKVHWADDTVAKIGYLGRVADRSFGARRVRVQIQTDVVDDLLLSPNELFSDDSAGERWLINEVTSPTDGFSAEENLHAAYAMLRAPIYGPVRAMAGLRTEYYSHSIAVAPPIEVAADAATTGGARKDTDLLLAGSLVMGLTDDMNIRAAYGSTVARPLVRELAPFLGQDFIRRRTVQGNPELQRTYIHNFDLRWEVFPSPLEVFALSVFYKLFRDPVESVIVNQNGDIGYTNIKGASNFGAELEGKIQLDRLSSGLDGFNVAANVALIQSEVSLSVEQARNATSKKRPLAGQSPVVANFAFGFESEDKPYSAFLFYNVFGRRIEDVGRQGLPDIYEEPFHSLDLTAFYRLTDTLKLSLSLGNLLMQHKRVTQGHLDFRNSNRGSNGGLKLSWSP